MKNNVPSAKGRFTVGTISWIHIYAKFDEDLLNTSVVISKTSFEQTGMLPHDYQSFEPNKIVKTLWPYVQTHARM